MTDTITAQPTATHADGRRLPLVVYVLAAGTFLMLTSEFVVAGILLEMSSDLELPVARIGSLITVFAVGMIIGAPVMTAVTFRLSKRLTLILALAVFAAGHIIVAVASDFTVLLVARFVTALATGAFWAVSAAVAARVAGRGLEARAVGLVTAGGALATVLGVPIGAFVAQSVGWRGTFWILAGAAVAATVLVALVLRSEPTSAVGPRLRDELAGLRSGRLWLTLAACAATAGGVLAAYSFIAPIMTELWAVPTTLVPLILIAYGVGSFIGTLVGARLGDSRPSAVTVVSPAVTALILGAMSLIVGASWLMTGLVVALGLFGQSANGVLIHLAVRYAGGTGTFGSALAVSAFNVGTAIGTAIAGLTLSTALETRGPVIVGAVGVAFAVIPMTVLTLVNRRRIATDGSDH